MFHKIELYTNIYDILGAVNLTDSHLTVSKLIDIRCSIPLFFPFKDR